MPSSVMLLQMAPSMGSSRTPAHQKAVVLGPLLPLTHRFGCSSCTASTDAPAALSSLPLTRRAQRRSQTLLLTRKQQQQQPEVKRRRGPKERAVLMRWRRPCRRRRTMLASPAMPGRCFGAPPPRSPRPYAASRSRPSPLLPLSLPPKPTQLRQKKKKKKKRRCRRARC